MRDVFRDAGFSVAAEAFADRRYEPNGTLRSRKFTDALIRDPDEAARQALNIVEWGKVIASDGSEVTVTAQTLCIHGDTPRSRTNRRRSGTNITSGWCHAQPAHCVNRTSGRSLRQSQYTGIPDKTISNPGQVYCGL